MGDLLTGGGGLIAASYTMTGASEDPKVLINPLSVLTPGILRTIFSPKSPEAKEREIIKKREQEKENQSLASPAANDNQTNTNLKTKKEAE